MPWMNVDDMEDMGRGPLFLSQVNEGFSPHSQWAFFTHIYSLLLTHRLGLDSEQ